MSSLGAHPSFSKTFFSSIHSKQISHFYTPSFKGFIFRFFWKFLNKTTSASLMFPLDFCSLKVFFLKIFNLEIFSPLQVFIGKTSVSYYTIAVHKIFYYKNRKFWKCFINKQEICLNLYYPKDALIVKKADRQTDGQTEGILKIGPKFQVSFVIVNNLRNFSLIFNNDDIWKYKISFL